MANELSTLTDEAGRSERSGSRRRWRTRAGLPALALAAIMTTSVLGGGTADARMTGEAEVVCHQQLNTITVRPRVTSNYANQDQWTATRVWIATYNGTTRTWQWTANPWKVELASAQNSPQAVPAEWLGRLSAQTFQKGDGYHYVYVQSYMWDGRTWIDPQGSYTRTYTLEQQSVSFDPTPTRTSSTLCAI